jgi:hypothetical protein
MSDAQNTEKHRGKPFAKGDARINRGGRPKGYNAFRKAFRSESDNALIRERLLAIIREGESKDTINAARLWCEYGWGKSPAAPEDNEAMRESGVRLPLTREEMLAIARGEKP